MFTSVAELKVFWVVGALERLATLGFLQNPPLNISSDAIDMFIEVDEIRQGLFQSDDELKSLLGALVRSHNSNYDEQLVTDLFCLVNDYKNDRSRLFKAAMRS